MRMKHNKSNNRLTGKNALRADIKQAWEQDNQAWWDWYVTLADNSGQKLLDLVDIPPLPEVALPSDAEVAEELSTPFPVTDQQCESFRKDGFIKISNVLSMGTIKRLRQELIEMLGNAFQTKLDGGVRNRFLSLEMMWLNNPFIDAYVRSERIAKISAQLLNVACVRLYHDNILSKEPGCGRTPWHFDEHHFPLATDDVVTAWIPAQPIPLNMGPLAFAKPLSISELVKDVPFNKFDTSYDAKISEIFEAHGVDIVEEAFDIGDVSFHHNRSFHTAGRNQTLKSRVALATTYFGDGARIVDEPTMVSGDWQKFIPGALPGDLAKSEFNPICWRGGKDDRK